MSKPYLEEYKLEWSARETEDYFGRFEILCFTQENMTPERMGAYFLNAGSESCYSMIKNLMYPNSPIKYGYENIKTALLQHIKPIRFEAAERSKFHTIIREESKKIRDFILSLQEQAAKCNFGDQLDTQLRDRLIARINNSGL